MGMDWNKLSLELKQAVRRVLQAMELLPAYEFTSTQLVEEYGRNELAAEIKYKGKLVQVSGLVIDIGRQQDSTPFISLNSDAMDRILVCTFSSESIRKLASLSKGDVLAVTGRVDRIVHHEYGSAALVLRNCKFQLGLR